MKLRLFTLYFVFYICNHRLFGVNVLHYIQPTFFILEQVPGFKVGVICVCVFFVCRMYVYNLFI